MTEHESCAIPSMTVRELLTDEAAESINLELMSGSEGLDNLINRPRIQMPGLALAGFLEYIHSGRVQVLGKSEIEFLNERGPAERSRILAQLCRQGGSCFVLTSGLQPPTELVCTKRSLKNPKMTAYQMASMPTRKKKSKRNSAARLNENRMKCA